MGKTLRKANGQYNGSVGDGQLRVPTAAPQVSLVANPFIPDPLNHAHLASVAQRIIANKTISDAEDTARLLLTAGVEFLEPYPGTRTDAWRKLCLGCGQENTTSLHSLRTGRRPSCPCYQLDAVQGEVLLRDVLPGWEPVGDYPGVHGKWAARCRICGTEQPVPVRGLRTMSFTVDCACSTVLLQSEVFEALDRLPGIAVAPDAHEVDAPGRVINGHCGTCGDEVRIRYDVLTEKFTRPACTCTGTKYGNRRMSDDQARARVLERFPGTEFLEPYPGVRVPWHMRCGECGEDVRTTLAHLTDDSRASLGCSCAAVGRTPHDEARLAADIVAAHPTLEVLSIEGVGGRAAVTVRCPAGHVTVDTPQVIKSSVAGCSECRRPGGYDASLPGYVYVITGTVDGRPTMKVGISNGLEARLTTHARTGMGTRLVTLAFTDGRIARDIENQCKSARIQAGVASCADEGASFDGKTESFYLDTPSGQKFSEQLLAMVSQLGADGTAG